MAATWDTDLVHQMGETVSTEARAKYNEAMRHDQHAYRYFGGKPLYAFGYGLSYASFAYSIGLCPAATPPSSAVASPRKAPKAWRQSCRSLAR
jgi:hypothetical protein